VSNFFREFAQGCRLENADQFRSNNEERDMGANFTKTLILTFFVVLMAGCQSDEPSNNSAISTGDGIVNPEELERQVSINTIDDESSEDFELNAEESVDSEESVDIEIVTLEADLIPALEVLDVPVMPSLIENDLEEDLENTLDKDDAIPDLVINNAPDVTGEHIVLLEDQSILLSDLLENDFDRDGDHINIVDFSKNSVQGGSLELVSDNVLKFTPADNFNGLDSFAYVVSDGKGARNTAIVNITVEAINDMPQVTGEKITLLEDESILLMGLIANDVDEDGDNLKIQNYNQGENGGVVELIGSNILKYTPKTNYSGLDSFTYSVSDGHNSTVTATVNILVEEVNDIPQVSGEVVSMLEDSSILLSNLMSNDVDIDDDILHIKSVEQSENAGLVELDGKNQVRYTPAPNYVGTDHFNYTISDARGGTAVGTVTIVVTDVNDIPLAKVDSFLVEQGKAKELDVLANDSGVNEDVQISFISLPKNGDVVVNLDGNVTYTPNGDYFGIDSFIYQVVDKDGESSVATAAIDVECIAKCSRVFNLSWEPSVSADVASYKVYYGTDATNLDQVVALTNVTNYEHFVDVKGEYYFAVSAVNDQNKESELTETVLGVF